MQEIGLNQSFHEYLRSQKIIVMRIWFSLSLIGLLMACHNDSSTSHENFGTKINYYELGQEITSVAQNELMKKVKSAMEAGGPVGAIRYCNVNASPLVDSLSDAYNCSLQRVSLKNRSPRNATSNSNETLLLNKMLEASLDGSEVKDTIVAQQGNLIYYKAIFIGMETCLKCHGQIGKEISPETMKTILELYPDDKATNYRIGEFRGVWKLTFTLD